jgi:predicted metalloendopeptidase
MSRKPSQGARKVGQLYAQDRLPGQVARWSGLSTTRDSYFDNMHGRGEVQLPYNLDKIGKPKSTSPSGA